MTVQYLVGDVRDVMATIADGSVDLIATSPPFLALRSYLPAGHDQKHAEIGSEANPAAYIDMLLNLTAEWGRVLAPHGSIAIELGDTYSGSGGAGGDYNEGGLRDGQGKVDGSAARANPGRAEGVRYQGAGHARSISARPVQDSLPKSGTHWPRAKSLALIPQLYAVALAYGLNPLTGNLSPAGRWLVRNVIVWHRPNPAVGALGDKVRPSTSYIVIATRSPKRWFDLTAVRMPYAELTMKVKGEAWANGERGFKTGPKAASGNNGTPMPESRATHAGAPPLDTWTDQYDGTHDTWTLTTQPSGLAHYAMWPARLAERLILMMCPAQVCRVCGEPRRRVEGAAEYVPSATFRGGSMLNGSARVADGVNQWVGDDGASASMIRNAPTLGWTTCGDGPGQTHCPIYRPGLTLDPFAGSGTTCAVADLHGRDAIGIDLDPRNHDLYPARYHEVKRALYGTPAPDPMQGVLAL